MLIKTVVEAYLSLFTAGFKLAALRIPDLEPGKEVMQRRALGCWVLFLPIVAISTAPGGFSPWALLGPAVYLLMCFINPWYGFFLIATGSLFKPSITLAAYLQLPLLSFFLLVTFVTLSILGVGLSHRWRSASLRP